MIATDSKKILLVLSIQLIIIIEMFGRFIKNIRVFLPLSLALASQHYTAPVLLDSKPLHYAVSSPRIKIINDISDYIQKDNDSSRAVLICQLHGDQFIDSQLIKIAQDFARTAERNMSVDFDFLFVKAERALGQELENYLIIYSNRGEKVINLEPYINHSRNKPNLKVSNKQLMRRLIEAINGQRQIRLANVSEELQTIANSSAYHALVVVPDELDSNKSQEYLSEFLKKHQIKSRSCYKYIAKDAQTRQLLGLSGKPPGLYLLSSASNNVLQEFKGKADVFKIGEKPFFVVSADDQLSEIFAIPPIQPELPAEQLVLNVYINQNRITGETQNKIIKELSKPQYKQYPKALFYTNDVEEATLTLQLNNYSKLALAAFDPNTPLAPQRVKQILLNTYEWNYPLRNGQDIDTAAIQQWISQSTGENKLACQTFKSTRGGQGWSIPLTGLEYKAKRDQPNDKIIYHYSRHCHGCKKFGGKYQQFARNRHRYAGVTFYRINNDKNKAEGVRNYNSTPVFVYYKQKCEAPFVYRMPIFTEDLFEAFITITGSLSLVSSAVFNKAIEDRMGSQKLVKDMLAQLV